MDVIGNNIANVNTTSYKSQATGFQDVLYQTVKQGTGAGENMGSTNIVQVGLGARVGSIYTNITSQGSAITTNNAYDLMITGESFFQISTDGGATKNYSRDGSFTIDAEGYLVTQANGYYVMGVMNGNVTDGAATERLQVIQTANGVISDSRAGTATSQAYFKGNIDSFDSSLEEGKNLMLEVFGTDGETYTIKFKLTDGGDKENNTFDLAVQSILDKDGNTIKFEETEPTHFVYDNHDGKLAENQVVTYNFNGDASVIGPLTIDFSNTSNYAGNSTTHASSIYAYKGDTQGLNKGYPNGDLTGISFGTDGSIYGTYSNGETIKKGQIAVAVFNNAMGLEKVGDNLYAESLNSGVAQIQDITKDGGYMQAGVLEGSNVDLAKEFTDMITTQRGFQANSRVITTSDEMLQVLRGLKR